MKNIFNNPSSSELPISPIFSSPIKKQNQKESVLEIPLDERVDTLMRNNKFMAIFHDIEEILIERLKKGKIKAVEKLKKANPQEFASVKSDITQKEIDDCLKDAGDTFLRNCFSEEEMLETSRHLLDKSEHFSRIDHDMLYIGMKIRQRDVESLDTCFGPKKGVFQAFIRKNVSDLADLMGQALKEDPRTVLKYGLSCLWTAKDDEFDIMSKRTDFWVARWLDKQRLRLLIKKKTLTPMITDKSSIKKEQEKIRRYQNNFKLMLIYYLNDVSPCAQNVFSSVVPLLDRMEPSMQKEIWDILFKKLKKDPEIKGKVIEHISTFLDCPNRPETREIFYHSFVKGLPAKTREELLSELPQKTLKQYWNSFNHKKNFIHSKIKTEKGNEYLRWYLFNQGNISTEQMFSFLKGLDLFKHREFFFAPKKKFNEDLFLQISNSLSHSNFHFWRWVKSFENCQGFKGYLAQIYPSLSIRNNKAYVLAMNNHFDLIHQCALSGDTASLSALKNLLGSEIFWQHLNQEKSDTTSGFFALCKQGKRGLLKLIADLPLEKQQALFLTPNKEGKRALDLCSRSFLRMVEENVFQQQYIKIPTPEKQEQEEKIDSSKQAVQESTTKKQDPEKSKYPRTILRLPYFDSNLKRLKTNPKLLQEVEDILKELSTMSGAKIQNELREGLRNRGKLEKVPCAVKDIRGTNYRLGYLVRGDADRNQGKIAFLFLWTHGQYNTLLNKQGPQLVRQAVTLMNTTPNPSPIPTNSGNSGR